MKQIIKVKLINTNCMPVINQKGDAFDLRASEDVTLKAPQAGVQYTKDNEKQRDVKFNYTLIPLGIAMELPKGFVADIRPRSSTYKKWYILQSNSIGLVDNSYNSNSDEWKMPVIALNNTKIKAGDKVCQFEIRLSQKATIWQKLKWLFTTKFIFVPVDNLNNKARGGFGSTGTN